MPILSRAYDLTNHTTAGKRQAVDQAVLDTSQATNSRNKGRVPLGRAGAVKFGLRPEHIGALARPDAQPVPVTLRFLEHMGSEVFVHFDLGGLAMSARVPTEQATALQALERGAATTLHFVLARAHLFDADSGVALR